MDECIKIPEKKEYRFDSFNDGKPFEGKRTDRLPAMGWNSWNAFGSDNSEELTKAICEKMVELGLRDLGYKYVVLDDGCYRSVRVDGRVTNEEEKFPSGFKALSDYVHSKGLLFGMYNDIGTRLCAGAEVGTCGHESEDAKSYVEWGIDFLKVDNCYYPYDNATFSDASNARFVYAPNIRRIKISGNGFETSADAVKDGILTGKNPKKNDTYVSGIGTFDGTGPTYSPIGALSGELLFEVEAPYKGEYELRVTYATGQEEGVGQWLQVAVGQNEESVLFFDDFLDKTETPETFKESGAIRISLYEGKNIIRIMNHRRQENTLASYAKLFTELKKEAPEKDILLSLCEWGKTNPHQWGYKVGDSWRILNDICFSVGSKNGPGRGDWISDYTVGIASQYNKAVIMDEFSGPDRGYNDPDMLVIGLDGVSEVMSKTHMTMWCMMNAPLMLGMDLRNVSVGDEVHRIISNKDIIALNQDPLSVQAKRIFCSLSPDNPDTDYIRDIERYDILAKPLADGSIALSVINLSQTQSFKDIEVSFDRVVRFAGSKMVDLECFTKAAEYEIKDLWSGEKKIVTGAKISILELSPYDNVTYRIWPKEV